MLTEAEKSKIIAEESFRKEVRESVGGDDKKNGAQLWKFLNSSLGILLVTATLITPAGVLFTHLQQELAARRKASDAIEQIDFELGYRLSQVLLQLYELTDRKNPRANPLPATTKDDVHQILVALNEVEPKSIKPLSQEYKQMGIEALIAERKRNTRDEDTRKELDARLAAVAGKRLLEGNLLDINDKAGYIIEELMMPSWKAGSFYFTDCIRKAPFC